MVSHCSNSSLSALSCCSLISGVSIGNEAEEVNMLLELLVSERALDTNQPLGPLSGKFLFLGSLAKGNCSRLVLFICSGV